jgi:iron complex transport system substrate-binding protein
MKPIQIFSLICALALLLSLASCSKESRPESSATTSTTEQSSATTETTATPVTTEKDENATVYPLSIVDSFDNEAVIESEPVRIVSCAPAITEMLFELGAGEKVVGRTDYCNYPAEVSEIESVGMIDVPSIEAIVALEPDLVIASSIFTEDSYKTLTDLGITVVIFHDEYDVDGVKNMISSVGEIINRQEAAQNLIFEMTETIEGVQNSVEELEKPTVYYAMSFGEYGDYTAGGDTYVHQMITAAGGDNIASDLIGWSYSVEKLVEEDPDVIIVNQYMLEDFLATPPYSELSAVKNGRVYGIDADLIERQGYRNAEGIALLADLFYPELTA